MKKYTIEELKQSKNTIMKFIIDKGNITNEDWWEVRKYYIKTSANGNRKKKTAPSCIKIQLRKNLLAYNNRIK